MAPKKYPKSFKASGGVAALPTAYMGTRWRFTDATNGMEYVGFFVDLIESTAGLVFRLGFGNRSTARPLRTDCTPTTDPISPHYP